MNKPLSIAKHEKVLKSLIEIQHDEAKKLAALSRECRERQDRINNYGAQIDIAKQQGKKAFNSESYMV